jgi:hypothetical protein
MFCGGRSASKVDTFRCKAGCRQAGATSRIGRRTKARRCARGCGKIGVGVARIRPFRSMISRSIVRGAFRNKRCRPNRSSISCNLNNNSAGSISPCKRMTPLQKSGTSECGIAAVRYQGDIATKESPEISDKNGIAARHVSIGAIPPDPGRLAPIAMSIIRVNVSHDALPGCAISDRSSYLTSWFGLCISVTTLFTARKIDL